MLDLQELQELRSPPSTHPCLCTTPTGEGCLIYSSLINYTNDASIHLRSANPDTVLAAGSTCLMLYQANSL